MRDPKEITKRSAASIAKWRMEQILADDKSMPALKRFAMTQAIRKGGEVDEIAEMLYAMGIRLTVDSNNPEHKAWIDSSAVILEK